MAYRIEVTRRAGRHLDHIYGRINAEESAQAKAWFKGLVATILSLEEMPHRCPVTPEDKMLRHSMYGEKPHTYRIIYEIDEPNGIVLVLFIRHSARKPLPERWS